MYVFESFTMFACFVCLQDLKDPRRRDDLAAARATLKKNSMMLLTTSKVALLISLSYGTALFVT